MKESQRGEKVNPTIVDLGEHIRTAGGALKNWLIATAYDALAVGLLIIGVP